MALVVAFFLIRSLEKEKKPGESTLVVPAGSMRPEWGKWSTRRALAEEMPRSPEARG
jgi:hypothetical protein